MAYAAVVVEGSLLPADLLERIGLGDPTVPGQRPSDFGLDSGRLSDEIQGAFSDVRSHWDSFQRRLAHSRESRTTLTRRAWIEPLLERLGYDLVRPGSIEVDGESYAFSHLAGPEPTAAPIQVVSIEEKLGQRAAGSRRSPHALVQQYLNRSDALWGLVTNGERLRLLRDTARQARPIYLEFDLRGMLESNQYSEFVLLYRLLHRSRLPADLASAHTCWLERYYQQGIEAGGRVRERLRDGVERALETLGSALLEHPNSADLRDALRAGRLDAVDYYRQLLRLIYRLLFLFVAEERRLLFPPDEPRLERLAIYNRYYSLARLRERAERQIGPDGQADLWAGLLQTLRLFREPELAAELGLTALNGELFGFAACQQLEQAACRNDQLLAAIRALASFDDGGLRRRVNFAALDVEELGSVYESLLDYHPRVELDGRPRFELVAGSERRQTGSYYTPPELVRELIEHALVPVMEERLAAAKTNEEQQRALLSLKVCDPAAGSGHFLLAAARRLGRELARLRSGEEEPAPEAYRAAVRDVIRNCLYAVDKNPLAVDLCKVALWIEGHSAGLPLSFLDHHVKCGDSLVGVADLAVLQQSVPNEAFKRSDPRQKTAAAALRKRNRAEQRESQEGEVQRTLDEAPLLDANLQGHARLLEELASKPERTPGDVAAKEQRYLQARGPGSDWWLEQTACHLWTAAFFVDLSRLSGPAPTTATLRAFLKQPETADGQLYGLAWGEAVRHRFFHWPLEFPDVFQHGGFDVILGNPPFMGGKRITGEFGDEFLCFLAGNYPPAGGLADLCAYHLRRAYYVLRPFAHLGMVATNSIGQGDTREGGLAEIIKTGGTITFVNRYIKWPGIANVEVNLITVRKGPWSNAPLLDGVEVDSISSRLDDSLNMDPLPIPGLAGKAFQGVILRGSGFILSRSEVDRLVSVDPRNARCIFPYLIGDDFNSHPEQKPSRWVINFRDWSLERAKELPQLLAILEERVRPERERVSQPRERDNWWLFARNRIAQFRGIAHLDRVLVRSRVSEVHALGSVSRGWVFDTQTVVFAFDDDYHFALLQSNVHEAWVRRNASTLRTDIRYTPTDCFETFPFPQEPSPQQREVAAMVGGEYHEHRRQTMLARQLGLTKTYNLFHDPRCQDQDIARLRALHAELDRTILACYGWDDLDPGHGFHQNDRGQTRYTISRQARRAVLERLLELNLEVAAREQREAASATAGAPKSGRPRRAGR